MRASALCAALAALAAACMSDAPVIADPQVFPAAYPEGPLWADGKLYYAEMGADRVAVVEQGAPRAFFTQRNCGPTALAPYGGGFLVLCHIGARVVWVDAAGRAQRAWDRDAEGARLRDPNDASADGQGGVYFSDPGAFSRETRPHGYLMYLSAAGELRRVAGPLWYPNGVYVDPPRRALYLTEHMTGRVYRYELGADGALGERRVFVDLNAMQIPQRYDTPYAETGPDGLEIGPNGDLFVAVYGEGRILRFTPEARLVGAFELPTRYVTNIAFNAAGEAATTGIFENLQPPFPGEVRLHAAGDAGRPSH